MTLGMIWTIILRFAIQDISVEGEHTRVDRVPSHTQWTCVRLHGPPC